MTGEIAFDEADLHGFVDSRIDPARSAAFARLLSSDPDMRARLEGWRRQNESLRTMFASVLSEPVPIRLVPASPPVRETPTLAAAPRRSRTPAGAVAAATIGAAMVGFVLGVLASVGTDGFGFGFAPQRAAAPPDLRLETRAARPSGLAERAVEAHRAYLTGDARPVEVTAAEGPKLLRWLQRRLGARLRVPDLSPLGWTLTGGRLIPDRRGAAAFLVYGSGADRLGLLVSRTPGEADAAPAADTTLGVSAWADPGFAYALTSDRGAAWLDRNGGALRNAVEAQMGGNEAQP